MLPPGPPKLSGRDFDPAAAPPGDEDIDMENQNDDEEGSQVELSSIEINILIYLYLLESNFTHTAFTLLSESSLPSTSLFQHFHPSYPTPSAISRGRPNGASSGAAGSATASSGKNASPVSATFGRLDGKIPRGELVRKLWKGLRWEEVERHVNSNGDPYKPQCPNPFHLLIPHVCPTSYPSSRQNPPLPLPSGMRTSPPPKRGEVFPPPTNAGDETEAGPSRARDKPASRGGGTASTASRSNGDTDLLKPKRKTRRLSSESLSRAESPARSQASGREKEKEKEREREREREREVKDKEKAELKTTGKEDNKEKGDKKRARLSEGGVGVVDDKDATRRTRREREDKSEVKKSKAEDAVADAEEEAGAKRSTNKVKIRNGHRNDVSGDVSREDSPVEKKRRKDRDGAGIKDDGNTLAVPSAASASERRSKSPGSTPGQKVRDLPTDNPSSRNDSSAASGAVTASSSSKGDVDPYRIDPSRYISRFTEHREGITSLQWNPRNPSILATSSTDGTVRIWEFDEPAASSPGEAVPPKPLVLAKSLKKPITIKHQSIDSSNKTVTYVAWHPEGSVVCTSSEDGVGRLFTPNGQLQGILSFGRRAMNVVKFSPEGQSIICAKDDYTVSYWRMTRTYDQQIECVYEAHTKEVNDVDWLDKNVFASAGNDHMIYVFHTADKYVRYTFKGHTDDVQKISWSPAKINGAKQSNDRLLASVADDGNLMIWKMPMYPADKAKSSSRSASPARPGTGGTLSGGGGAGEKDDVDSGAARGKRRGSLPEHCVAKFCVIEGGTQRMNRVQWSPACRDGRMLVAAAAQDTTVKIYDVETEQLLHHFKQPEIGVSSFAFSPLNIPGCPLGAIVTVGWTGHVLIFDVASGEKRAEYQIPEESAKLPPAASAIAWRDDGRQIALGLQTKTLLLIATPDLGPKKTIGGK